MDHIGLGPNVRSMKKRCRGMRAAAEQLPSRVRAAHNGTPREVRPGNVDRVLPQDLAARSPPKQVPQGSSTRDISAQDSSTQTRSQAGSDVRGRAGAASSPPAATRSHASARSPPTGAASSARRYIPRIRRSGCMQGSTHQRTSPTHHPRRIPTRRPSVPGQGGATDGRGSHGCRSHPLSRRAGWGGNRGAERYWA